MTDMDEIRELLSEYADAVFDRGAASGASNEVYPPNAGETSSRSALLQRVEALREERDAAAAQSFSGHDWNRLLNERDAARAAQKRAEEALREGLKATRWWGHEDHPETWCWCEEMPCDGEVCRDHGCVSARAALAPAPPAAPASGCLCSRPTGRPNPLLVHHTQNHCGAAFVRPDGTAQCAVCWVPAPPAALRPVPAPSPTSTDPGAEVKPS